MIVGRLNWPFAAFTLGVLMLTATAKPAFADDWGATFEGDETEVTAAVADSTNLNDGFDWYAEADIIDWQDLYIDSVGIQGGVSSSMSDGADFGGLQTDNELDDAYISSSASYLGAQHITSLPLPISASTAATMKILTIH